MKNLQKLLLLAGSFALMLVLSLALVQPAFSQDGDMSMHFEKSLAIWNEGKFEVVDEVYSADIVRHAAGVMDDVEGVEAYKAYVKDVRTIYPDFQVTLDQRIAADDWLTVQWTVTGTNEGALNENVPATGKKIEISGVTVARFADGKIAEEWAYWNHGAVLSQLGFTMTPPAMAEK